MGLFILPGRLVNEFEGLAKYLTGETSIDFIPRGDSPLRQHYSWVSKLSRKVGTELSREEALETIHMALGEKCARVLADAGVFKEDAGTIQFLETIGYSC